jgi:parallel beta-helix repeat protein
VVGTWRAFSDASIVAMQGLAETPTAVASTTTSASRSFYVDSKIGNDNNDGLSPSSGAAGRGPWRTLARVASSNLSAGDALRLACNSVWNETLKLPSSGTSTRRIVVGTPIGGCTTNPIIDGSVQLPAASWTFYKGNIYHATLATAPLALTSEATPSTIGIGAAPPTWTLAHHPNRGHNAGIPSSPYLTTAAASDSVAQSGGPSPGPVSTTLITGSDLMLPSGASLVGAGVRIRTYPWWIDESTVASVSGRQIKLGAPTWWALGAGWGYYFTGKQWMVDSDGEWFHDAATQRLYAYLPSGRLPAGTIRATVLATGIDLNRRDYVTVENLVVRRVGVGADMRFSTGSTLRNSVIEDTATYGADVTATFSATVEASAFTRTGLDSISGWRHQLGWSVDLVARNNVIRDSGVVMDGEEVLSLPRMSLSAILGGERSTISGNTIINAGYIGILVRKNSVIEKNFVYGACTVLDDCAGIFTQYANDNGIVRGNTVVHVRGALLGKAPEYAYGQGQGIYMDESASGILIENNTVIDADNGILVHVASNNTVRNNRLYANRRSQIWMHATRNNENPAGDVVNNLISSNLIAPVVPGAVGVLLETMFPSTAAFGTIDGNRYFDRASTRAVMRNTSGGSLAFSFADWQASAATDLPSGRDARGSATSATRYASYGVSGANIVPNGNLATSTAGWNTWNATAPQGQLVRESCSAGTCARYVAGGSTGMVSSQNFSVTAGQWYRLSVDVATDKEGQEVNLMVRRGGGGNNGYEMLSDRSLAFQGTRAFKRQTVVFQATTTVRYRDPITGDLGARVDIQPLDSGKSLSFANVELVPVAMDATAQISNSFINAGITARSFDCPYVSSSPALCSKFRRLADDTLVSWPLSVAALGAEIVYAQEPQMLDSDGDGIPDAQDSCPATPARVAVNASGCPLTLR